MKLTEHITIKEAVFSATARRLGIDNTPSAEVLSDMRRVAEHLFEPLREYVGDPIAITSFYRSPELNARIGGSPTSDHCNGHAIDIDADVYGGVTNAELFDWLQLNAEPFHQLIWEFGDVVEPAWVHVSWRPRGPNRRQVLRAVRDHGRTLYLPFDR